jgi:hypothetical protein
MTDEETKSAKKQQQKFRATVLMAFLGAITAVGDGVRSCNEREQDQLQAAQADQARVETDQSIQDTVTKAIEELHVKHDEDYDELADTLEAQDRELFELRVENEMQARLLDQLGGIDNDFRDMIMLEALEAEAIKENHVVRIEEPPAEATPVSAETHLEEEAEKIATKKRRKSDKRKERPAPKIDFAPPEPVYEFQQQMQQRFAPKKK